jgi:hypothetical protein
MWQQLWKKWTIDKPAAFGDWLWNVFVVQFAAFLDRLTWRKVIAVIPLVLLAVAYAHHIPVPPELALVGDLLAYIDVFSVLLLLGVLSRVTTILYLVKQLASQALRLAGQLRALMQRLDIRHRRERGTQNRKRLGYRVQDDGEDHAVVRDFSLTIVMAA